MDSLVSLMPSVDDIILLLQEEYGFEVTEDKKLKLNIYQVLNDNFDLA